MLEALYARWMYPWETELITGDENASAAWRVSMDQTILDVTDIPGVAIVYEMVMLGEQAGEAITAGARADLWGTIFY